MQRYAPYLFEEILSHMLTGSSHLIRQAASNARLVLLLQFLHLHNLFHPNPARDPSFAPPSIPPALQSATAQEVAAIGKLFDELANGPLEGGHGDVLEQLAAINEGNADEALPGVPCELSKYPSGRGSALPELSLYEYLRCCAAPTHRLAHPINDIQLDRPARGARTDRRRWSRCQANEFHS